MTTSSIARLFDNARVHLPSALDGVMRLELFNVVREFTQRSDIWHERIPVSINQNQRVYDIVSAEGGLINRLIWVEGNAAQAPSPAPYQPGPPQHACLLTTGAPSAQLEVFQFPSADELWFAHVALTNVDPSDKDGLPILPDWIYDKYHLTLLEGLLSKMMSHPAKPYTSKDGVLFHGRRFLNGIGLAKTESRRGFLAGGQRWAYPSGFRTHTQRTWGAHRW